jgi:hypothetical protein
MIVASANTRLSYSCTSGMTISIGRRLATVMYAAARVPIGAQRHLALRDALPLTPPLEHRGQVWNASFSPDSTRVVGRERCLRRARHARGTGEQERHRADIGRPAW